MWIYGSYITAQGFLMQKYSGEYKYKCTSLLPTEFETIQTAIGSAIIQETYSHTKIFLAKPGRQNEKQCV